jgi:hypothetical protein
LILASKLLTAGTGGTQQPGSAACTVHDLEADDRTDADGLDSYKRAANQLLMQGQFSELDCVADFVRVGKVTFASGAPKLHILYDGLRAPLGHATDDDWKAHLARLERWVALKPQSITARVALASAYEAYAWDARGQGASDTVTESGWRLFGERVEKARQTLEQADALRKKCPEWHFAMLAIALDQGWKREKATEVLNRAIAFEPGYYYDYFKFADFVSPKWYGEAGDPERFAAESADRAGGAAGDILYFHIAADMIVRNRGIGPMRFSWPRIQKGYAELEKQYGTSLHAMNQLAYIANEEKDFAVAAPLFQHLGDRWEEAVWECTACFEHARTLASNLGPDDVEERSALDAAKADMQTDEGRRLAKDFLQRFGPLIRDCVQGPVDPSELEPVAVMIHVKDDGLIRMGRYRPTGVESCLSSKLFDKQFEVPHGIHWLRIEIDPRAWLDASDK